ncbi:MAG: histone deacetylase, partial [Acidobacteria bacterium]|nr:histone deacetylase [Acidobacteriota bacterium]
MSLLVITSERFGDHVPPPGHPERPERAEVMDVVAARWHARGGRTTGPRAASREELLRAHSERHIDMIAATAGTAVALDPDTFTSPDSYDVALFAAGAAIQAVDAALAGESALALVRPPGHHAERTRAMGFCLFNNVAVAAA